MMVSGSNDKLALLGSQMKRLFVTLFAVVVVLIVTNVPGLAQAQTRDRLSVTYDHLGNAEGVSANFYEANANHRFFLDEDGASLLTVGAQYRSLQLQSTPTGYKQLELLVPQFSLAQIINDEYSIILNARPGFFGDFEGDFGRSFRFEGGAVVTKVYDETLTLGLGVGRGSNFGRDLIVPLLQVLWLPTSTVMVDVLLPVKAEVWYLPSRTWEFGALFNIVGSLYRIDDPALAASQLGFANMNLGLGLRRNIQGNLYASLEAGYTVSRRFEFANDGEKVSDNIPAGVPYGRLGLNWRF